MRKDVVPLKTGFGVFLNTVCDGVVPAWYDDRGLPIVFETERDAQEQVVELLMDRLDEFMKGQRDFQDATTLEDFVLPVSFWADGSVTAHDGQTVIWSHEPEI